MLVCICVSFVRVSEFMFVSACVFERGGLNHDNILYLGC